MIYSIRGVNGCESVSETRKNPASATVLAMRWTDRGVKSVEIVTSDGRCFSVEAFRRYTASRPRWI